MKKYLITIFVFLLSIAMLSFVFVNFRSTENNFSNEQQQQEQQEENIFVDLMYCAIGDSVTYGTDGINGGRLNPTYLQQVGNILGLKSTINYGIGGSTIADGSAPMYKRYNKIQYNADIISVMGGINDFGNSYCDLGTIDDIDGTTFYGAYNIIVSGLKAKYPNAFIFLMTPTNYRLNYDGRLNDYGHSFLEYVNAVKEVGSKYNIPVLDLYSVEEILQDTQRVDSDGVHHSQELTNNVVAPIIAQFIKDNYKK